MEHNSHMWRHRQAAKGGEKRERRIGNTGQEAIGSRAPRVDPATGKSAAMPSACGVATHSVVAAAAAAAARTSRTATARVAWRTLHKVTLGASHIDCLPLAALLDNLELNPLAFHERAETGRVDCALMDEQIFTRRPVGCLERRDESIALLRAEPLHLADLFTVRGRHVLGPRPRRVWSASAAAASAGTRLYRRTTFAADVRRLKLTTFVDGLVLDLVILAKRAKAVVERLDGALVHEEIVASLVWRDESEALLRVEPLDGPFLSRPHLDERATVEPAERRGEPL
mmetsp:Transcript_53549/g.123083  ORF Transcript_53549/g.123083 Transcript_53549/m.123083 type:complete len:285 (-) Transcript_53549:13-867(-)